MANPDPHPTPAENTSDLSRMLEGRQPVDPGNDIDDRMTALEADHIEMGARQKVAGTVDAYESTYPLTERGHAKSVAEEKAEERAARAKKTTDGRNTMPASTTTGRKRAKKSK